MRNSLLLVSLLVLVMTTGCWDRQEINDIALVLATGVDYVAQKEVEISVEVKILEGELSSGGGGSTDQTTFVQSARGNTLAEAISVLQQKFSRELFWGHNRVIVFDEEFVRRRLISDELDYFTRFPESRIRDRVVISHTKAKKLLSEIPHLEKSSAELIRELLEVRLGIMVTIRDVLQSIKEDRMGTVIPVVDLANDMYGASQGKQQIELVGSAIFKEGHLIDVIDVGLTRGLLWFRNEIDKATVTIEPEEEEGFISTYMIHAETKLIPEIQDGQLKMTVQAISEDDVIQNTTGLNLSEIDTLKSVERQLEERIQGRLEETAERVQKQLKSDVFGFGIVFNQQYPDEWKELRDNWDGTFATIDIEYDVKVHVRRLGLSAR
ncbi:Ger(x)C family spore germination protein [Desertibacillus haloalkaliphilus]|uniref:Ger(x)C family spore germination protein n=1 Tax=Desertibacillus haloalkaliphilus TaxID=1328930 RepID=UPI001C2519AA|nr:Ger(x)C family spore germination protein [Desertibacillus haloalkaliphilus]MBU8906636.1 Ger(x)C family spore germination protein [Desertibacillus haloalkaliphilus]